MKYTDTKNSDVTTSSDFYFSPLRIIDADGNVLYEIRETEKDFWNQQELNLTIVEDLKNPIEISIPTNKTVQINVDVWDYDSEATSDFVRSLTNMIVPFHCRQAGEDWDELMFYVSEKEATLTVKYRILQCDQGFSGAGCNYCVEGWTGDSCSECAENYYPAGQCTKFCEPETNRYTCTSEGEIKCLENREGDKCEQCTENFFGDDCSHFCEESLGHTCNGEGDKICKANYYPDGTCTTFCKETYSYICSMEGKRTCKVNFYPENECNIFCVGTSSFTCNEQGHRICKDGYYPASDCTVFCTDTSSFTCNDQGQRICKESHYPEGDCTVFCEETSSFTCNDQGQRICKEDHYPAGDCTVLCEETASFTCNEQGQRICKEDHYPEGDCTVFCEETSSFTCNEQGQRICKDDHYPEGECTIFCKETSNFTCSKEGQRICKDELVSERDCTLDLKNASSASDSGIGMSPYIFLAPGIGIGLATSFAVSLIIFCFYRHINKSSQVGETDENLNAIAGLAPNSAVEEEREGREEPVYDEVNIVLPSGNEEMRRAVEVTEHSTDYASTTTVREGSFVIDNSLNEDYVALYSIIQRKPSSNEERRRSHYCSSDETSSDPDPFYSTLRRGEKTLREVEEADPSSDAN